MRRFLRAAASGLGFALAVRVLASPAGAIPDSIAVQDVPSIPARIVEELNRYQNIRLASFQDWAPNGKGALILTRFGNTNQVHRVEAPLADRSQLTFLPERVLAARSRPGHDEFLYSTDEGGAENFQLWLFDLSTGSSRRLTDGRSRNVEPVWSHSGRRLAWASNARNGKDMDLYVLDLSAPGPARRVKEVSGEWSVLDWSPDERRLAACEFVSINESRIHSVDAETGQSQLVSSRSDSRGDTVAAVQARWSIDGKSLYVVSDEGSEFRRLFRYDFSGKPPTPLSTSIPWDADELDLSDDGSLAAFVANEEGYSRLHLLELANGREAARPEVPSGEISGLRFRPGSRELGFTLSSPRTASDVYSYDPATRKLTRWTRSETGGLDPGRFPEPSLVHYSTFDGRKIPAFVYRPAPTFRAPFPVLVVIHGGPEGQSRPGFLGRSNYYVAELGLALVYPNVRGSTGYGKTYSKLDNGKRREDSVSDIGALLDWIRTQPDLDASRVAVTGGSYGGYMTLAALTHYSDRLKAGMESVGISNFVTFLTNTQDYRRDLRRAEYGDEREPAMKDFLQRISPLTSAGRISRPLLIAAGQNDPRVPVSESEQMAAEVRKNKVPVWFVLGKNEGHGFQKKVNQDYLQAAQVLFVKRFLLGEPEEAR